MSLRSLLDARVWPDAPLLMGVVNVTPDSFSDGGQFLDRDAAFRRIDQLRGEGAQIIDIGGESTRPTAQRVSTVEQIRRILEPVCHAAQSGLLVSIDTTDPDVAGAALDAGATIVNDVSCLRDGSDLAGVAAQAGAALILMHAREPMAQMTGFSEYPQNAYGDVVGDVMAEWSAARARAVARGMSSCDVLFDPGLGFNKNAHHSSESLRRLREFRSLGASIVVGPSRKSFLAAQVESPPTRRLGGTVAACLAAWAHGAAILRVHDVLEVKQALAVARAVSTLEGEYAARDE